MIYPTPTEIAYRYCFNLLNIGDMVIPHYWSNLFLTMRSLLTQEEYEELKSMVVDVEYLCGYHMGKKIIEEKQMVDGQEIVVKKEIEAKIPNMNLYELETYLFNSWNLKSYFLVNGKKITQFEIEQGLMEVKRWCFTKIFELQSMILFTKPPIRM